MGKTSVAKHFDAMARDFEKVKRKVIPGYREIEKCIFSYLPFTQSRRIAVLELGTGTGSLALDLMKHFPRARYTGIDFSDKMLEIAAHRLRKYDKRVILQNADLNKIKVEGRYDLIISLFTIHHVFNKKGLLKNLYALLKPGGCFFYADAAFSTNRKLERQFIEGWKDFMARSGLPRGKIGKVIEAHRRYDHPETIETQLHFLKAAGFKNYDIVWCREKNAAFFAVK
jgi:ubiquinone/menaquinone biosynthesis C-methylase UbiE